MTVDALINALNLPVGSRVGQRVPKKLLLENGASTAADKRLINDGIEEIHWIAAMKPATLGVPAFRDDTREYVKIVLDGDPVVVVCSGASALVEAEFLEALDVTRQPRADLFAFYQGWLDVAHALQAAQTTGIFKLLESADQLAARRAALQSCIILQVKIASLRSAAGKASQMARQIELNIELKRTQAELEVARAQL
jgi:hypothetical protein